MLFALRKVKQGGYSTVKLKGKRLFRQQRGELPRHARDLV